MPFIINKKSPCRVPKPAETVLSQNAISNQTRVHSCCIQTDSAGLVPKKTPTNAHKLLPFSAAVPRRGRSPPG